MSKLEEELAHQIAVLKLPEPVREYRFAVELVEIGRASCRERV